MPEQYGLIGILMPLALLYVLITLVMALFRGRVYGGIFWGTVHRRTSPGRYWFTLFCGLMVSAIFTAVLARIYTGVDAVSILTGLIRRLLSS
ncbi:MAG: hypothetical protein ACXU8O_08065 [Asticcacaulis sp.]